jgi:hypothetical protein
MAENRLDLEAIFFAARHKPPQDRAAFLDQVCGDDLVLRGRAEQFLFFWQVAGIKGNSPGRGVVLTGSGSPQDLEGGTTMSRKCLMTGAVAHYRQDWP